MNKKIISFILVSIMCLCLVACGNNTSNSVEDNTGNVVEDNTSNIVKDNTSNTQDDKGNVVQEEVSKEPDSIKVEMNNTVTLKKQDKEIEFTLTDVVFENEVYSNSDNMFASYFPDIEEESYIVAKITIKNIGGDSVDYNFFDDITVIFDNKFNYGMQQLDLESSVMSQYWSCQPLKSVDIYWVQSVPDEVKTMGCNISFMVEDILCKYQ